MTLLSFLNANFLSDYLAVCGLEEAKRQIRSWVYHSFNPQSVPRQNFLGSFIFPLVDMLRSGDAPPSLFSGFDIICDILIVTILRGAETDIPGSFFDFLKRVSDVIAAELEKGGDGAKRPELAGFNVQFGKFLFLLFTLSDAPEIISVIRAHLWALSHLQTAQIDASFSFIWEFLTPFSETPDFTIFLAEQLPVQAIGTAAFSAYQPIVSLLLLAFHYSLSTRSSSLIDAAAAFFGRCFISLEESVSDLTYRAAYALFPLLDIISSLHGSPAATQPELLPIILFLLGYAPRALLRNGFSLMSDASRGRFITFLESVVTACCDRLSRVPCAFDAVFHQLTARVCRYLLSVIRVLPGSVNQAVSLVTRLFRVPWQIAANYACIFDVVCRLIRFYECQKALVSPLLQTIQYGQHTARAFASAVLLLLCKADYDRHKSVIISSVNLISELTSLLLQTDAEDQIPMYLLMLERIQQLLPYFKDSEFSRVLGLRLTGAQTIGGTIQRMRAAGVPADRRLLYVQEIAEQFNAYPSMKIRWLKALVRLNSECLSLSSALVAQLHICTLISAVIDQQRKRDGGTVPAETRDLNLIVCQPILHSGEVTVAPEEFGFIPSVLEEARIDFDVLSDEFRFIAADFTLDYLYSEIVEAVKIGTSAKLYYSLRPLLSFQLRIASARRQSSEMAEIFAQLADLFEHLSAIGTVSHRTSIEFFLVQGTRIYAIDEGHGNDFRESVGGQPIVKVLPVELVRNDSLEHFHCWNHFEVPVELAHLNIVDANERVIWRTEYTTALPLPALVMFADVLKESTIQITFCEHATFETNKAFRMMENAVEELEDLLIAAPGCELFEKWRPRFDHSLARAKDLIDSALIGTDSLFTMYKLLVKAGGRETAEALARGLFLRLKRLIAAYLGGLEAAGQPIEITIVENALTKLTGKFRLPNWKPQKFGSRHDAIIDTNRGSLL
jgi:hypothetical protein